MKLTVVNTARGLLIPDGDADYEAKQYLKKGETYVVDIRMIRNPGHHRKYFAMIRCAWSLLPQHISQFYGSERNFRKCVEIAAGYSEKFYSPHNKEWIEGPRSIAYENLDQAGFEELYDGVRFIVDQILQDVITPEEFDRTLASF